MKKDKNKQNKKIKNNGQKPEKDRLKTQKRQFIMILLFMAIAIFVIFIVYFVSESLKTFEYVGLDFEKIKIGEISFYHTKIPIKTENGEIVANYNLYLRNDPRELKNIPVEGTIKFLNNKDLYVSVNPNVGKCGDASIALIEVGKFLKNAGLDAKGATTDNKTATENHLPLANCATSNATVIVVQQSSENQIIQYSDNCYLVEFKECDYMTKATERFMIAVLGQSRGYAL